MEEAFSRIQEGNALMDDGNDMGAALRYYQAFLSCARTSLSPTLQGDGKVRGLLRDKASEYGLKAYDIINGTPWAPGTIEADVFAVLGCLEFMVDCGIEGEFPEDESEAKSLVRRA
eukprot:CAMPEP_0118664770 /NCGR_PEP_ID=MMETSP0785-20121206/18216_1 /TAXON_ID=91992 /ORGANISM="Bolidomonas pacifica, Strain CCMP 1866" /LENGTH=115 /DNA_ID=CAMNT_0006558751 /DNA_START=99 /DNA_END=442 /DNA_ORIENTATION=-